jgi:polyphosphate kinase
VPRLAQLLQSPFTLHKGILERIEREMDNVKAGKPARIMFKVNGLTDAVIIRALYEASQAGVQVDLIVRGLCCLRPGLPEISENIRVRSIVGRFLEHTRVYYFANGDEPEVFLASADLMERNLHKRIEVAFPILHAKLKERVIQETFHNYLADNCYAWLLQPDGTYVRALPKEGEIALIAQTELLKQLSEVA